MQGIALTGWRQRHERGQVKGVQARPGDGRPLLRRRQVALGQFIQQAQGFTQVLCGAREILAGLWPTLLQLREHFAAQVVAGKLCVGVRRVFNPGKPVRLGIVMQLLA
ncbi:hypothetical protein D3C81_1509240 [compost metagenome]